MSSNVRIVPAREGLPEAAERLRTGKLVAFPTETVYGLGANALDANAVAKIFAAKGRPATNPLIVHVATMAAAKALCSDWPPIADTLAACYWPGPLTLVVERADPIPEIVTAGGTTVGLRVPDHPVALELLQRCGVPVAAPSANRSEQVSPTTARHVADSLANFVDDLLILDGGACRVGIESTVIDATGDSLRLLRPGMVSVDNAILFAATDQISRAPGQMPRHYAPSKTVTLISDAATDLGAPGLLSWHGQTPTEYARNLYARLRALDADAAVGCIRIELPPDAPEWAAVRDRLHRAAAAPKASSK